MATLTFKEITTKVREQIKASGVKAFVKMNVSCGNNTIRVDTKAYGLEFTREEQEKVRQIGIDNGFTWVRGIEIVANENTNPFNFVFFTCRSTG